MRFDILNRLDVTHSTSVLDQTDGRTDGRRDGQNRWAASGLSARAEKPANAIPNANCDLTPNRYHTGKFLTLCV